MEQAKEDSFVIQLLKTKLKYCEDNLKFATNSIGKYFNLHEQACNDKLLIEACVVDIKDAIEQLSKTTLVQGGIDHA